MKTLSEDVNSHSLNYTQLYIGEHKQIFTLLPGLTRNENAVMKAAKLLPVKETSQILPSPICTRVLVSQAFQNVS